MGGPHKRNPIPFRPGVKPGDPDGDREWLLAYADETGRPVGAIVSEAVAEYRARRGMNGRQAPETTETAKEQDHG